MTLGKPKGLACRTAIDEEGFAAGQTCEGIAVGAVDLLAALIEPHEQLSQVQIAIRGRRQSTCTTGTPSRAKSSAKPSRPMFMTRGVVDRRR